jgi:hypothetical protein
MAINSLSMLAGLPIASKLLASAGQASISFLEQISQLGGSGQEAVATSENEVPQQMTLQQRLSSLSGKLRNWLSERGVSTPFELKLSAGNSESALNLETTGDQAELIRQLVAEDPDQLAELQALALSAEATSQSLGRGDSSITITADAEHIAY